MRLKEDFNDPDRPEVATYRDFDTADRDDFQRKEGRLFSTLERQRIIFSILEGPRFEGCAQLDLDLLVPSHTAPLSASLALIHTARPASHPPPLRGR